ncbi:DnaB-like helicase C-terminal domain-containing protein [Acinetobacter sp.]|uniref:DnaB-like helicase C-terminal domain-containing protein n=1 Tax=Acinetobacter sp. TaxID=472 RepID=UPI000C0B96C1|nr:DnaB-like helicase C-terminal domain-containing protein [Acinetobacter sp.]MAK30132.1 hypothetical protein [Acinetobacter sp.]QDP47214.1 MAG: putative ATP-dependent helicase [Prokaryotic dsDNA virus sp.]|tara:strand:- start:3761 stop:5515 length:1755 start_codon:yes stop_codon:yes gene_type:complete
MIREFAFGINKRHHFHDANQYEQFMGYKHDTFCSLYYYDEEVVEYFAKNKTLSGYDGALYMPDEFILDVDGPEFDKAIEGAQKLSLLLDQLQCMYSLYFSGRGFHFGIPSKAFQWNPDENLHVYVKKELTSKGIFEYADSSVTDKTRLIRILNTKNTKSGFYKVDIEKEWLFHVNAKELITNRAKSPNKRLHNYVIASHEKIFNVMPSVTPKKKEVIDTIFEGEGRQPDAANYTCIQRMLSGTNIGQRHAVALRLAAHFRWLYPEPIVRLVMENWRKKVDKPNYKFSEKEMESIIKSSYDGHNGEGNRYGCSDVVMDKFCSKNCRLYKSKADTKALTSLQMENQLIDFYREDRQPINIGELYGQDFPIYPGEVVILQAPPASMKTMLLQNWMVELKRPTYFIEMEMSARQIWSRFVMIENEWSQEQLEAHYKKFQNGQSEKFKWLTVDYSSPYPFEIEKRISMMPRKPELIIVDHMGLFRSKHKDMNMKCEEASQALMELAVKHNVVVFAVSEINKSAFKEGMDISSARGSFRIAYNANKLLSLKPFRDQDGSISYLELKSDKNREREHMRVKLKPHNVKLKPC